MEYLGYLEFAIVKDTGSTTNRGYLFERDELTEVGVYRNLESVEDQAFYKISNAVQKIMGNKGEIPLIVLYSNGPSLGLVSAIKACADMGLPVEIIHDSASRDSAAQYFTPRMHRGEFAYWDDDAKCSACRASAPTEEGTEIKQLTAYCPDCGARMIGVQRGSRRICI